MYSCLSCQEAILEQREDDSDCEPNDTDIDSYTINLTENKKFGPSRRSFKEINQRHSPTIFSPMDSPRASPKFTCQDPDVHSKKRSSPMLRLLSNRAVDPKIATASPDSPSMNNDYSTSSPDSDSEVIVCP